MGHRFLAGSTASDLAPSQALKLVDDGSGQAIRGKCFGMGAGYKDLARILGYSAPTVDPSVVARLCRPSCSKTLYGAALLIMRSKQAAIRDENVVRDIEAEQ